jgi:hypothetical protein
MKDLDNLETKGKIQLWTDLSLEFDLNQKEPLNGDKFKLGEKKAIINFPNSS